MLGDLCIMWATKRESHNALMLAVTVLAGQHVLVFDIGVQCMGNGMYHAMWWNPCTDSQHEGKHVGVGPCG